MLKTPDIKDSPSQSNPSYLPHYSNTSVKKRAHIVIAVVPAEKNPNSLASLTMSYNSGAVSQSGSRLACLSVSWEYLDQTRMVAAKEEDGVLIFELVGSAAAAKLAQQSFQRAI